MGRSTGQRSRVVKKKKVKVVKALEQRRTAGKKVASSMRTVNGEKVNRRQASKLKSQLLKRQAKEKVVLKHHIRELEDRRKKIVRGQNARMERRELAKYIRQLGDEQAQKHERELAEAETVLARASGETRELDRAAWRAARTADDAAAAADDDDEWTDVEDDDDSQGAGGSDDDDADARTTEPSKLKQLFANLL